MKPQIKSMNEKSNQPFNWPPQRRQGKSYFHRAVEVMRQSKEDQKRNSHRVIGAAFYGDAELDWTKSWPKGFPRSESGKGRFAAASRAGAGDYDQEQD